jgi:hypothetical protein
MAFSRPSGRRAASSSKRPANPLDADRRQMAEKMQELKRKEAEVLRLHEAKIKEMQDLPRRIAEREKKERERMRERALSTATNDVFGPKRNKRPVSLRVNAGRMTSTEQKAARFQFLLLCAVLFGLLIVIWKSIPLK